MLAQTQPVQLPPPVAMLQIIQGFWTSRALLEYCYLLAAAGLKLTRIIPTRIEMSVIEVVPA